MIGVLSPARAIAHAIHSVQSLQINIFTDEVLFRLNITWQKKKLVSPGMADKEPLCGCATSLPL